MKMIDSILVLPLLIGVLCFVFFTYRKLRIDLFRDKVFQIRRALFLIAADNPEVSFQANSFYRFFESILNATLNNTEHFTLWSSLLEATLIVDYSKKNNLELFDFDSAKKSYLKKIKSLETRKEVAKQIKDFEYHYIRFLLTRTFSGLLLTIPFVGVTFLCASIKIIHKTKKVAFKKEPVAYSVKAYKLDRVMNNSQFAYAASLV